MFPANLSELPEPFVAAMQANPEGFSEAMGTGMEAFQDAMEDGGDMGAAFEAMGDAMGPMMEDMGVSQEMFDAVGDMVGAGIGGGMHMASADSGGPEMGAIIADGVGMMMPEGMEVPGPITDALVDMGQGMADSGCDCHDVAAEMMPDAGQPGSLPVDGSGEPVVVPGDPASCPADACQPPPPDGAMAEMPHMMPPEGGHDHVPMTPDMQIPGPMAVPDPTGELSGSEFIAEPAMATPDPTGALSDALGGSTTVAPEADLNADAADAAIGAAMDGAMDQGGSSANVGDQSQDDGTGPEVANEDSGPADPSAGMG
jgi:hypothetical protein